MLDNQPPALENYNLFRTDRVSREAVAREAPDGGTDELTLLGELAGRTETIALGFDANEHPPELRTHDRFGERIDEVRFHPAWHTLMAHALRAGLAGLAWEDPGPNPHVRRAAKFFLWSQVEAGHGCPVSMTYAAVPVVRGMHAAAAWVRALTQPQYDARALPIAQKTGGLCAMGMTERQGGSDVRTNQTRAMAATTSGSGQEYLLNGQKWFCSAPASDAFLVLAQAPGGISCFFVPRVLPDATRNAMQLVRLKDKLGNRSNASAEVEFHAAHGWLIGDEGEGLRRIVEMVNHTRLDCALGSAGLMRAALAQAIHHATYRRAFGKALIDQPLMQNVLADLALESEAATLLVLRLARAVDDSPKSPAASALKRIGTALAKYYICKRAPAIAAEALECLGGNGYVEESIMPRLYREAPLNSIWEGCGNLNALDVVRVLQKQPDAYAAWRAELEAASDEPLIAAELLAFERDLRDRSLEQAQARALAEKMALLWQTALLHRYAPGLVARAFLRSRLGAAGRTLGTLPPGIDFRGIIDRAAPLDAA
ncbi:MAG TPA: acyl-CoA dehydrogenase family protein [Candidatus Cybelea sp.]|nr:acyl-CoA dehydrogenase family protein [Candidatus Cybelea sp.]